MRSLSIAHILYIWMKSILMRAPSFFLARFVSAPEILNFVNEPAVVQHVAS